MSFRNIELNYTYDSGEVDLLYSFYVPVLEQAYSYDRIAGYFTSTSLAVSARGIAGLIKNGGKMRILVSPRLSPEDIRIIDSVNALPKKSYEDKFISELDMIENEFEKDHLKALGWMLSNEHLEIKVVMPVNDNKDYDLDALFHQKVGILKDVNGDFISFSGSINETAKGWLKNIEEFKVFRSWIDGQADYLKDDQKRFNRFWKAERTDVKIHSVSEAIRKKLIDLSSDFDVEKFIAKKYKNDRKQDEIKCKLNLFSYQKEALNTWIDNGYNLLFEMATGTGKTRTAIGCIHKVITETSKFVCIVSCPQSTLSLQWKKEIEQIGLPFDKAAVIDGTNAKWRSVLKSLLNKIEVGFYTKIIIYTNHVTSCKEDFIVPVQLLTDIDFMFIGDEVHGLGASKRKKALLDSYKYRIGLSATPSRWFDDVGTLYLREYFGSKSFEFTIRDALINENPLTGKPFLVNYYYKPIFVSLTDEELDDYMKLSNKIRKMNSYSRDSDSYQETYENLLFMRSNIVKSANKKYQALLGLVRDLSYLRNVIVFVVQEQIDCVMDILSSHDIDAHRFTQKQGKLPDKRYKGLSEREYLINKFKEGFYDALVAIKCLDEGIDIPSAKIAVLMANSTNPREYIQRIGRVIRQSENKDRAYIYDIIVEPDLSRIEHAELKKFEIEVFNKDLVRVLEMSRNAINNADVLDEVNQKYRRLINGPK
ncbi:DEAD/DEAH box helicase family protein [Acidaminobacter sp. JC074]|uniref:DEAD/DEAH box helicase family protein n=1 Tax=Acidaminobacter sp. JC074 TaxID=2530199 RepID=UPI001F0FB48E|nr:DEAD/DEAH box helicase family protein [Acidaminobacter sp. JC074]